MLNCKNGRSLTCKVFRYHHHLCDFVSVPLWEVWCWEPAAACQQTARGSCSRLWERWSHRRHFHSPRICDGSVQRRNIEFCRYIYMYIMINHSHTIVQLSSDTTVSMMLPIGYRLLLYTQQVSLKVDMFKATKVQGQGVLVPYIAGLTIQTPPFWPPWVTAAQVALWQSFTTTLPSTPSGSRHRARASTGIQISKSMRLEMKYQINKNKQINMQPGPEGQSGEHMPQAWASGMWPPATVLHQFRITWF